MGTTATGWRTREQANLVEETRSQAGLRREAATDRWATSAPRVHLVAAVEREATAGRVGFVGWAGLMNLFHEGKMISFFHCIFHTT
jgi:hypothetical protein